MDINVNSDIEKRISSSKTKIHVIVIYFCTKIFSWNVNLCRYIFTHKKTRIYDVWHRWFGPFTCSPRDYWLERWQQESLVFPVKCKLWLVRQAAAGGV